MMGVSSWDWHLGREYSKRKFGRHELKIKQNVCLDKNIQTSSSVNSPNTNQVQLMGLGHFDFEYW